MAFEDIGHWPVCRCDGCGYTTWGDVPVCRLSMCYGGGMSQPAAFTSENVRLIAGFLIDKFPELADVDGVLVNVVVDVWLFADGTVPLRALTHPEEFPPSPLAALRQETDT